MRLKILYRTSILLVVFFLLIIVKGKDVSANLKDIPDMYAEEINYLIDRGVINGYPDNTFRPNTNVTRQEAVTMVGRLLNYDGTQRATYFNDVKKTDYSSGYIQSAVEKGTISKDPSKNFRPLDNMSRGEVAYFLSRVFGFTEEGLVSVPDVKSPESLVKAVNVIITAGLSNGYPDGTFKPNNSMTRAEFALFVARGMKEEFRVSSSFRIEGTVNATSLNVRSGPSESNSVIGSLINGSKVVIKGYEGDWVKIIFGDSTGYVHKNYIVIPSKDKIIAIDAGHGGKDPGAIGNGLQEKEINLAVALKVEQILKQQGIKVVMTRSDDTFLELSERVQVAVAKNADTFVSIHANKFDSESANGTETYFSTASLNTRAENSKKLAEFIQNRLYKALGTTNRGVKQANYHVISKNPLPATLVELGFISNGSDASKLASESYRQKAAEAIAFGIVDYYNWRK